MSHPPRRASLALALAGAVLGGRPAAAAAPAASSPAELRAVVVLEYRAGTKGAADLADQLARLLRQNAALQVIDLPEARRRGGAQIDAEVARCTGEPRCVAGIGARLKAAEVLLVGVSQLGDVVLALQRIDVRRGEVAARLAAALPESTRPTDADALDWLRQLYPPEDFRRYGAIRIDCDIDGARVSLNGADQGQTPLPGPLRVRAPATYRVRVERAGRVPFQAKIDVLPEATVEVRAQLPRDGALPWYKRWYVWAAVGGVAAATAAGVAIYYSTRVDETPLGFINTPSR